MRTIPNIISRREIIGVAGNWAQFFAEYGILSARKIFIPKRLQIRF